MAKILIVDDQRLNQQLLVQLLSSNQHEMLEASNGAEALLMARSQHPDLIMSDVLMPTMDGYEFVRQLRSDPNIGQTRVIFITGHYLGSKARALAKACGVFDIIYRPCAKDEILRIVEAALQSELVQDTVSIVNRDEFDREHMQLLMNKLSRSLFDNSIDGMFQSTRGGRLITVNPSLARILAYDSPEEAIESITDIANQLYVDPSRRAEATRLLDANGVLQGFEFQVYSKTGDKVWLSENSRAVRDENGEELYREGTIKDITALKHAEEAQRKSQQQFESLVHSIDGIVWEMNGETFTFTFVSRQVERLLGYTREEWIDELDFWPNHLHPDDREWVVDLCKEAIAKHEDHQFDYRMISADGKVIWLRDFVTVDSKDPDHVMLRGVMVDITERKRSETEREIILEIIEGVITTRNLDELLKLIHHSISRILFADNCFVALHDPTTDKMHFAFWIDQLDPIKPDHSPREGFSGYVLNTNQPLLLTKEFRKQMYESGEVEMIGSESASWLGVPLRTPTRVIGVLVTQHYEDDNAYSQRDLEFLTSVGDHIAMAIERKRAEQEKAQLTAQIEDQRQRLNTIIANIPGVVWEAWGDPNDAKQQFNFVSDYVETLLGYSVEEWLATPNFWLTIVHPDDRERAGLVSANRFAKGENDAQVFRWIARDGHIVWVEAQSSVIRDSDGKPIGMRGVNLDITERKQAEEALLQSEEQLRQSQKLEAVGQLAGGVAHDFNNLLTVITGYSDLALRRLGKEDPLRTSIEEIKKASERAAGLTRQLLAFSRKQVLQPVVLKLNSVVTDVDKMLRRLIGENIDVLTSLDPALGQIKADPGQIEQVILNLAVNARDAMPEGGKLTIETANVYLDNSYARKHLAIRAGQYVLLAVSDTGCGMNAETQARMFEPFFTTKESGKGTGLGLSTVYGIVKQSGGNVWVYSEEGKGTTFKVYLPCVDEIVPTNGTHDAAIEIPRGLEMVLLAEDEEQVRQMTHSILEMNGYSVIDATNGAEALSLYEKRKSQIDLVLTDAVMPFMSGRELSESLRALTPDIKVLYMSGYTDDAIVRHGLLDQKLAFLQKPFTPDALLRKVREVLDGPQAV